MKRNWLSRSYIGVVLAFLYVPILVLIVYSFNSGRGRVWQGFTVEWYSRLFQNDLIMTSLANTLIVAVASSLLATLLGTAAAVGIFAMKPKTRSLVMNITYVPVINPEIVIGVSLVLLFSMIHLDLGFATLILAHVTFNVPYVILNVMPKLRQMDKFLYESAMDLGCSPNKAFFKVVIHEIAHRIIRGLLMSFTYSLDDFIISYFVSGPTSQTLPITIYSMMRRKVSPEVNALSTIIFLVVLVVLILVNLNDMRTQRLMRKEAVREDV